MADAQDDTLVIPPRDEASGGKVPSSRDGTLRKGKEPSEKKDSSAKRESRSRRDSTGHVSPLVKPDGFDLEAMSNKISSILLPLLNKSIEDKLKPVLETVSDLQNDFESFKSSGPEVSNNVDGDSNSGDMDFTKHLMGRDSDEENQSDDQGDSVQVDTILDDLTQSSSSRGPVMPERVASFTQFMLDQSLQYSALQELLSSFQVPENMEFLTAHDLPEQISSRIKKHEVSHDEKFTLIQSCILKGLIPVVNCLAEARSNEDSESVKAFSNSIRLLTMAVSKLNGLRYHNLKYALPSGWKELCDKTYPYGPMFGESIQATVKAHSDSKKLDSMLKREAPKKFNYKSSYKRDLYKNKNSFKYQPKGSYKKSSYGSYKQNYNSKYNSKKSQH